MRHFAVSLASVLIFSVPPSCVHAQNDPPASAPPTPASAHEHAEKSPLGAAAVALTTEEYKARLISYLANSANNARWWGLAEAISTQGALAKVEPRNIYFLVLERGPLAVAITMGSSYIRLDSPKIRDEAGSVARWEEIAPAMSTSRRSLIRELAKAVSPKVSDPLFDQLHDTGIAGEAAIKADFATWNSFSFSNKIDPLEPRPPLDAKARAAAALESLREELRWTLFLQILSKSDRWPWNQMSWRLVAKDIEALVLELKEELPTLEHAASADPVPDEERLMAAEEWNTNAYNFTKRRIRLLDDTYSKVFQKGPAWVFIKGTPELDALRKPADPGK